MLGETLVSYRDEENSALLTRGDQYDDEQDSLAYSRSTRVKFAKETSKHTDDTHSMSTGARR